MQSKIKLERVVFELTTRCNHQCKFCYNHWKGTDTPVVLEESNFSKTKKVLQKIFAQAKVDLISFSGGEPMLFSRIHDLLLMSRFHKTQVSVLTNGTLLDELDLYNFKEIGVKHIQIPILSADAKIHDILTQKRGSWEKSTRAALNILQTCPEKLSVVLVLTRQNIYDLDQTLYFFHHLGVKSVLINRFNIGGSGRKYKDELELSHEELQEAFSYINEFSKKYAIKFHSGVCTPMCVLDPARYPEISFSFCNKEVSERPITINAKGDVRFCNHSPTVLGNILEQPLQTILYNTTVDHYFNTIPSHCTSCNLLQHCGGGCRAASEQIHNTFSKADPLIEKTA